MGERNNRARHSHTLVLISYLCRDSVKTQSTPDVPMSDSPTEPPLAPFKDEVLRALISDIATLATTRAALAGLAGFVLTQNSVSSCSR
jgi:hypothetical protein